MLAKKRVIRFNGAEVQRTPLLVPSFSSKGFPHVSKILQTSEEVIENALLVSAYDIHHGHIKPPFDFAAFIFLDSGGYEASKDAELSDLGDREYKPQTWTQDMHNGVVDSWESSVPTVLITYDHPNERLPIPDQIERAKSFSFNKKNVIREILLKPETKTQTLLKVDSIIQNIHSLVGFDIIGVTEKEIGNSLFNRMENIAKLRIALMRSGLDIPIHIFGSLDTISTPLYFLAGADIFDGLTWLRFAFRNGQTIYKHNFGALELGIKTTAHIIDGRTWFHNYRYMVGLEMEMRRFLKDQDFSSFSHHSDLFKSAHDSVMEAVGA